MNYTERAAIDNTSLHVSIRFDDKCNNGHPDFAITATMYENGRDIAGGCLHNEIQKFFGNKFNDFIALHLADHNGTPMHAIANMRYHMGIGRFNEKMEKAKFCKYYRISPKQYGKLLKADDETHFYILLRDMGILAEWQNAANKAIEHLEKLTGEKYIPVEYPRSNLIVPSAEDIALYNARKETGYYTQKAIKARKMAEKVKAKRDRIAEYKKECQDKCNKAEIELNINLLMLKKFGVDFDNYIYYNHTNTVKFNWRDYSNKITQHDFNKFVSGLSAKDKKGLPENIQFTL